jgi:hypothetical protein
MRVLAQILDIAICHRFRLVAEQLAASRDRDFGAACNAIA